MITFDAGYWIAELAKLRAKGWDEEADGVEKDILALTRAERFLPIIRCQEKPLQCERLKFERWQMDQIYLEVEEEWAKGLRWAHLKLVK